MVNNEAKTRSQFGFIQSSLRETQYSFAVVGIFYKNLGLVQEVEAEILFKSKLFDWEWPWMYYERSQFEVNPCFRLNYFSWLLKHLILKNELFFSRLVRIKFYCCDYSNALLHCNYQRERSDNLILLVVESRTVVQISNLHVRMRGYIAFLSHSLYCVGARDIIGIVMSGVKNTHLRYSVSITQHFFLLFISDL